MPGIFFGVLVLLGIMPIFATGLAGWSYYVFIIYNILIFLMLIVDVIITPSVKKLEVYRECDGKFSLGAENIVSVRVRNNSNFILNVELKDEIPPYFTVKNETVRLRVLPHSESTGEYVVIPQKRGEFVFGNIHFKYSGIMRLCTKMTKVNCQNSYKVYPNIKDIVKYGFATIRKNQLQAGSKKAKVFGMGTEFESLREYTMGDDYRKINWMATARANKLIVNSYEPEKNQQVFILIDSSRVMNSEINTIKKLDYAINASFLLAEVTIKKGDNIGLLVFDSEVRRFVKPGKGSGQFQLLADNLYNVEENLVTADYAGALSFLNEQQKRRSLLCIFTELFNAEETLKLVRVLKTYAIRHVPLIITINDPRLAEISESEIKTSNDVFLKGAARKLIEQRNASKSILAKSGIDCIDVPPDTLSVDVVNKYLLIKEHLKL